MTAKDTAYSTKNAEALTAYKEWKATTLAIIERRNALSRDVGRDLWLNGSGFSTHIVGFARFDSDEDGDTLRHDQSLIVSKKSGTNRGMVVPNMRRKSGQKFAAELKTYTVPSLDVPGVPGLHVYVDGSGNTVRGHADVWLGEDVMGEETLFALWHCDNAPMDPAIWETCPLSVYYAAREKWERTLRRQERIDAGRASVSGNTEPSDG